VRSSHIWLLEHGTTSLGRPIPTSADKPDLTQNYSGPVYVEHCSADLRGYKMHSMETDVRNCFFSCVFVQYLFASKTDSMCVSNVFVIPRAGVSLTCFFFTLFLMTLAVEPIHPLYT